MMMIKETCFGILPLRKTKNGSWEVLIALHAAGSYWGFPKGHLRVQETPQDAAIRELQEETALQLEKFLPLSIFTESYIFSKEGKQVEKTVSYFAALVTGEAYPASPEILETRWEPVSSASSSLSFEGCQNICLALHRALKDIHSL